MWLLSGRCYCKTRLDGKTVLVTGANCGIGKFSACDFVKRGAHVIIACRDLQKANQAAEDIRHEVRNMKDAGEIVVVKLDLSSLESIRESAQHILRTEPKINILVNNAGVCYSPKDQTSDGFEIHIGVNHLGAFLFTCLLLPRIIRSAPARIITISSCMNYVANDVFVDDLNWEERRYSSTFAYAQSKLANVMFSNELGWRLRGTGVTTYALHPGVVITNGTRHLSSTFFPGLTWVCNTIGRLFCKNCEQGSQTTIHCAVSEQAGKQSGLYYSDCKLSTANPKSHDAQRCAHLWEVSSKLVGLGDWDPFTADDNITPQPIRRAIPEKLKRYVEKDTFDVEKNNIV